jgi:DUF1009 family protein
MADAADPEARAVPAAAGPIAIIAGSGALPPMVSDAVRRAGRPQVVLALAGEADSAGFAGVPVHALRLGEVGRLWRLLAEHGCTEALLIGAVSKRPDLSALRPDLGGLMIIPRILKLMRGGDDRLFSGIAEIFAEKGVALVSALDVAPELALRGGIHTHRRPSREDEEDIARAAEAARVLGALDIGQAAVAVGGRVVAVEGAEGTEALIERVGGLRTSGRIAADGGVLVKRIKPQQDRRIDMPTIGPATAGQCRRAGLAGVAASADATLLAGRDETVAAFDAANLFLVGITD